MINNDKLVEKEKQLTREIQANKHKYLEDIKLLAKARAPLWDILYSTKLEDIEILAKGYRRRGDVNINLYLNSYVLNNYDEKKLENNRAEESFKDYEQSIKLFDEIGKYRDKLEAIMAYGNAFKEKYLPIPSMPKESFQDLYERAKCEYEKCVEISLKINEIRNYHFVMLEQMNLSVRREVWEKNKRPKRIVIFHSLKSPESHRLLHGIRYFAYKNLCEVWEYHYGSVPPSDYNESFIKDRLEDACAAVFLASPEYNMYDEERPIIKFEIEETLKLKQSGDPIGIFVVDLGNKDVVRCLKDSNGSKDSMVIVISPEQLDDKFPKFLNDDKRIKNIYFCRSFRCADKK